jgi:hypothetical protein
VIWELWNDCPWYARVAIFGMLPVSFLLLIAWIWIVA